MAASSADLLTQVASVGRPQPTQVTSARAGSGTTLNVLALTGWATATKVHGITYKINTSGAKIAGTQLDFSAIVNGTQLQSFTVLAGTDNGNAIGDIVELAPTAGYANDLYSWGSAHANTDGSLKTSAVQTALSLGTASLNGWNALGFTFSSVTNNGNRSYTCVVSGNDVTSTLSPGMRIRTTRTVAAPTQSTSLNGTTQFWSKTTPGGMTFTNFPVHGWWIKLTSYNGAVQTIASRYNGTSGHTFTVNANGQLVLAGFNAGSANFNAITSYQAVPLNRWVHVAGELDMSTATLDGTHSWLMIDGADVLAFKTSGGTNPTALIQAGNLEIGSQNGGLLPFTGKIASGGVFSAAVTETTMRGYISQGLAGTETSLISAYNFNGNANDLNTTNANNLTSNNGAAATNADSPFGGQASGTISSTLDYAEIIAISFSTNTTVTVTVPDGNAIPTSGGVASVVYSSNAYPYGYPPINNVLGISEIRSTFSTTSITAVQVSGLSATISTVVGRRLRIKFYSPRTDHPTTGQGAQLSIWLGTVGSGSKLNESTQILTGNFDQPTFVEAYYTPTTNSLTFNGGMLSTNATAANLTLTSSTPAYLVVENA